MKKLIVVSCLLLVVSYLMVSCGLKTETTRYFYGPSWVRDGKVIFVGEVNTADKDVLGSQIGSSYSQYVATIYPAGTGESSSLFDTTDTSIYSMSCSPATDYAAYMAGKRGDLFSKIFIRNIASGAHTSLEAVELRFIPGIRAFDWSPDGTKLVYCTTTEVKIIDVDGANDTLVTAEAGLEFVSWQYGGRIAFYKETPTKEGAVIYSDGSGRQTLGALLTPQISSANTNEVWGFNSAGTGIYTVDLTVSPTTLTLYDTLTDAVVLPRLSPDAAMFTYSKSGQDSGIYVYTISTKTESTVKN